jgi:peptide/nickel transport system ATP-binding protein
VTTSDAPTVRESISDDLLEVDGLSIGFGPHGRTHHILSDVSLRLAAGETLGIVGESGCGKSTLAGALLGRLPGGTEVRDGRVSVAGHDLFRLPSKKLRELRGATVALVPQNAGHALTPTMRVGRQMREVLTLQRGLSGKVADEEAARLFAQVRLPQPDVLLSRYPHELSGGQQQRVGIALALAGSPRLLVLDEPTTGLDVVTQAGVLDLLATLRAELGLAMIVVSHDLGVIASTCDRVAVMYAGRIVETGPTTRLYVAPSHPYTRALLASVPLIAEPGLPADLPGSPPKPGSTVTGCAFADRCPVALAECRTGESPPLRAIDGDTRVACIRAEEVRDLPPEARPVHVRAAQVQRSTLVSLRGVEIRYRNSGAPTVADIDLDIQRGETLALVGESGSGKSTVAWAIGGLHAPSAGTITFAGSDDLTRPVAARPASVRRRIQMVFQNADTALNPRRLVREAVRRPLRLFGLAQRADVTAKTEALFTDVGLDPSYQYRLPAQLSGGQRQRVGIARALAARPDLVLADEVVSALDVSVQAAVLRLLDRLRAEHHSTYVFISHDLAVVRSIADRVAVLYLGRLCEVGDVADVFAGPSHPYTRLLVDSALTPDPRSVRPSRPVEEPESAPSADGCPFQRRCPHMIQGLCDTTTPPWRQPDNSSHRIRCHLDLEDLARA